MWASKESNLGMHPVFGLVFSVRDVEFSQAFGLKSIIPSVSRRGPCFTILGEDGDDRRFIQLNLACEAESVASPGSD